MNIKEVEVLVRIVESNCPAQKIDSFTPLAWHPSLAGIDAEAAIRAVGELSKRLSFIGTREIVEEVARVEHRRMQAAIPTAIVQADPDDVGAYKRELDRVIRDIGTGRVFPHLLELGAAEPVGRTAGWIEGRAAMSGHSVEFLERRARANTVRCDRCGEPVGRTCTFGGVALTQSEAHPERLEAVGLLAPHVPASLDVLAALAASEGRTEASGG